MCISGIWTNFTCYGGLVCLNQFLVLIYEQAAPKISLQKGSKVTKTFSTLTKAVSITGYVPRSTSMHLDAAAPNDLVVGRRHRRQPRAEIVWRFVRIGKFWNPERPETHIGVRGVRLRRLTEWHSKASVFFAFSRLLDHHDESNEYKKYFIEYLPAYV